MMLQNTMSVCHQPWDISTERATDRRATEKSAVKNDYHHHLRAALARVWRTWEHILLQHEHSRRQYPMDCILGTGFNYALLIIFCTYGNNQNYTLQCIHSAPVLWSQILHLCCTHKVIELTDFYSTKYTDIEVSIFLASRCTFIQWTGRDNFTWIKLKLE